MPACGAAASETLVSKDVLAEQRSTSGRIVNGYFRASFVEGALADLWACGLACGYTREQSPIGPSQAMRYRSTRSFRSVRVDAVIGRQRSRHHRRQSGIAIGNSSSPNMTRIQKC